MSQPLRPDDPCYFMLERGRKEEAETPDKHEWRTKKVVHRDGCYICEDPEFALMGMPLCRKCPECGGHIAADDTVCDDCGFDEYIMLMKQVSDSNRNGGMWDSRQPLCQADNPTLSD